MLSQNKTFSQEYLYDFSVDGGATGAIDLSGKAGYPTLPEGAVVQRVFAIVETAVVGTSSTLAWGNTTDPDGYHVAVAEASLTANSIHNHQDATAALLYDDTNDHEIYYRVSSTAGNQDFSCTIGTANLTAGKVRFVVEGYFPGRSE